MRDATANGPERPWLISNVGQKKMRILTLTFAVALLALTGCASRETREHTTRIESQMRAKYDLDAMTVFLKRIIAEHPAFGGVALSTNVSGQWQFEPVDPPSRMRSGDWVLWDQHQDGDTFELYFITPKSAWISIEAKRLAKDRFGVVRISRDDVTDLIGAGQRGHVLRACCPNAPVIEHQ